MSVVVFVVIYVVGHLSGCISASVSVFISDLIPVVVSFVCVLATWPLVVDEWQYSGGVFFGGGVTVWV